MRRGAEGGGYFVGAAWRRRMGRGSTWPAVVRESKQKGMKDGWACLLLISCRVRWPGTRGGATERLRRPWHRRLAPVCRARTAAAAPSPALRPAWLLVARAALRLDSDAPLGFVVGERRRSEGGRRRSVWRVGDSSDGKRPRQGGQRDELGWEKFAGPSKSSVMQPCLAGLGYAKLPLRNSLFQIALRSHNIDLVLAVSVVLVSLEKVKCSTSISTLHPMVI